jgi:nitrogen fixation NifU-like protein
MSSMLKGKTLGDAEGMFRDFRGLVTGALASEEEMERLGKLAAFAGVSEFPARVKCASLPWHTLHAALDGTSHAISTE